jgi:hypothetical protein
MYIVKCCHARFSGQDVRGGCAGAERWITKTNPVRSLDACFAGHVGRPVHALLRAVQVVIARGAASLALLHTLGFSAVWLRAVSAVLSYKFS